MRAELTAHLQCKVFRLNWATHGLTGGKSGAAGSAHSEQSNEPEFSLFVGDLAQEVSDFQLMMAFRQNYQSVHLLRPPAGTHSVSRPRMNTHCRCSHTVSRRCRASAHTLPPPSLSFLLLTVALVSPGRFGVPKLWLTQRLG